MIKPIIMICLCLSILYLIKDFNTPNKSNPNETLNALLRKGTC